MTTPILMQMLAHIGPATARVVVFTAAYAVFAGALHLAVRSALRLAQKERSLGEHFGQVAFETASLLQFFLWVPLGLGYCADIINPLYLYALPTAREVYDLLVIFVVDKKGYNDKYGAFVAGHHAGSNIARLVLALHTAYVFWDNDIALVHVLRGQLLYYTCSAFLVAPAPLGKLFLNESSPIVHAFTALLLFVLARVSHAYVAIVPGILYMWTSEAGLSFVSALVFSALFIIITVPNEYYSVAHGGWGRVVRAGKLARAYVEKRAAVEGAAPAMASSSLTIRITPASSLTFGITLAARLHRTATTAPGAVAQ